MDSNKILKGTEGKVWFNGQLLSQIKSIEIKITGNFEDVNVVGSYATYSAYTGWNGEGTITLQKIDSTVLSLLKDAFKTGVMPEIKIITKLNNPATGKAERTAIENVVVTELMLAKFEAKGLIEESMPFKFSDYTVLEAI